MASPCRGQDLVVAKLGLPLGQLLNSSINPSARLESMPFDQINREAVRRGYLLFVGMWSQYHRVKNPGRLRLSPPLLYELQAQSWSKARGTPRNHSWSWSHNRPQPRTLPPFSSSESGSLRGFRKSISCTKEHVY